MSLTRQDLHKQFLATGVGSLSSGDALGAVTTVCEALEHHMPFWPQLPRVSFYENMYVQFSEKLPGIFIDEPGRSARVNTQSADYLTQLESCFHAIESFRVDDFAISRPYAQGLYLLSERLSENEWQGWVKAQVIGPISLGLTLLDENKNPILYNPELFDLLPSFLALKAAWLVRQMRVTAKTRVVIFIDEPYLVAVGTSQCSLSKEVIIDKINRLVAVIHDSGALAGLHCCGNTDWDMVLESNIDIVNFDAYGYLDKLFIYEKAFAAFLKKGGVPAFGIVPNNDDVLQERLVERLCERICARPEFLVNGALITTSCGCSALAAPLVRKTLDMCVEVADRLKGEF